MLAVLLIPLCIIGSFAVATWAGDYKKIGFWWTFFFGLTLTPFVAFVFAALSAGRNEKSRKRDLLWICMFSALQPVAGLLFYFGIENINTIGWMMLVVGVGVAGLTRYLYKLATS